MKKVLILTILLLNFCLASFSQNFIGFSPQMNIYSGDITNSEKKGGVGISYMREFADGHFDFISQLNIAPIGATDKDMYLHANTQFSRPAPFQNRLYTLNARVTYSNWPLTEYYHTPIIYTGITGIKSQLGSKYQFGIPIGLGWRYSPKLRDDLIFELGGDYTHLFKDNIDNYDWKFTKNKDYLLNIHLSFFVMLERTTHKGEMRNYL